MLRALFRLNLGSIMGRNDATNYTPPTVYANKANWNPIGQYIEIVGRYHGSGVLGRHARYIESSHSFDVRYYSDNFSITHNFDQSTLNPTTGPALSAQSISAELCCLGFWWRHGERIQ